MIGRARFAFTVLGFGYAFLYLPLVLVMLYSFNESRLVTVWGGFSTKWWGAFFTNDAMLQAAWLSLRIAAVSATLAAVVGLAAGYALSRAPSFPGRGLLGGLVIAPMVMPEVVMGISMLLLFVGAERLFGGPERGFLTIVLAHTTFSIAFVAMRSPIVRSILRCTIRLVRRAGPLGTWVVRQKGRCRARTRAALSG